MTTILRTVFTYLVLLIIFRAAGKRTLKESSPFSLILLFLISSAVSDALKDGDHSLTNGFLLASTLVITHYIFTVLKQKFRGAEKVIDDVPILLARNGEILGNRVALSRVTRADILAAARQERIYKLDDIQYAILEINGNISIVPKEKFN